MTERNRVAGPPVSAYAPRRRATEQNDGFGTKDDDVTTTNEDRVAGFDDEPETDDIPNDDRDEQAEGRAVVAVPQAPPRAAEPTKVGAIASQTTTAIDTANAYVLSEIDKLISELTELRSFVVTDGLRVKLQVNQHVEVASEALTLAGTVRTAMEKLKREREK